MHCLLILLLPTIFFLLTATVSRAEIIDRFDLPLLEEEKKGGHKSSVSGGGNYTDLTTGMEFVWVEGGCYQMGNIFDDGSSDEKPAHEVCVDGFYLGKYEVTQGEWQAVMGYNPSYFKDGDNYPVERVIWNEAQDFIGKLNQFSGRTFRLPTEAEWEYAARSRGKKEKYSGGDNIKSVAWYNNNSNSESHPVGTKQPNGLGIYDMSGNVAEWCQDWYSSKYYSNSPRNNPQGPSSSLERVPRGGSWYDIKVDVRSTFRFGLTPDRRYDIIGFRLVMFPGQ